MYLVKKVGAFFHSRYKGIYNRFGYQIYHLAIEGCASGKATKEKRYFVSTKKIYSNRFSTDAYNDIFADGLKKCKVGLNDMPEYRTHKATESELKSQNSF